MASNCHGVEPIGSVKRWSKAAGTMIDIPQPHVINKYNKNMGGVHRMDQNIGAYRISMINPFTKVVVAPIRLPAWRRHAERIADLSTYGGQEPSADWSAGVSTQCMQCILQKVQSTRSNACLSREQWGAQSLWISEHPFKYAWMATTTTTTLCSVWHESEETVFEMQCRLAHGMFQNVPWVAVVLEAL